MDLNPQSLRPKTDVLKIVWKVGNGMSQHSVPSAYPLCYTEKSVKVRKKHFHDMTQLCHDDKF